LADKTENTSSHPLPPRSLART